MNNAAEDEVELEETGDLSAAGSLRDYDYLLDMPISSLTAAKAKKLLAQRDEKENELQILLDQSPKSMWLKDLDAFEAEWQVTLEADEVATTSTVKGKNKGKVNTISEAFNKAAAKSKAKPAAGASKKTAASAKPSPKTKPKKKVEYQSDMSEDENDLSLHDETEEDGNDDEEEDDDDVFMMRAPSVPKARKETAPRERSASGSVAPSKAPAKPKEPLFNLDESSPEKPASPKRKRAATSGKKTVIESDAEDDDETLEDAEEESFADASVIELSEDESFVMKPKKKVRND